MFGYNKLNKKIDQSINELGNRVENFIKRREDFAFDVYMDALDKKTQKLNAELLDVIFTVAVSAGVTAKKLASNFKLETLEKFSDQILVELDKRKEEELKKRNEVKNVYDKPKAKAKKAK